MWEKAEKTIPFLWPVKEKNNLIKMPEHNKSRNIVERVSLPTHIKLFQK